MFFHFDRHGKYRGYSVRPLAVICAAIIIGALALAVGYQLFLLAPIIALWALVIWAYRSELRRYRARRDAKMGAQQPQ